MFAKTENFQHYMCLIPEDWSDTLNSSLEKVMTFQVHQSFLFFKLLIYLVNSGIEF